jgi:hypothetical protein
MGHRCESLDLMRMKGLPMVLNSYGAQDVITNRHFREFSMKEFENVYLPESMAPFTDEEPSGSREFIVDDNRGAVSASPFMRIDGTDFHLSVKGVGSTTNPFSRELFDKAEIGGLVKDPKLRERIVNSKDIAPRYITGELWLRGSPYGGQGLQHATTSMRVSEMADLTSIHGFRFAPQVKTVVLPEEVEREVKNVYWYRRFGGRIAQETRLVPSNIRIYFHSGSTVGGNASSIFDLFGITENEMALEFLINFVRSGIAFLTLFARSLRYNQDGSYSGLDFYDVWLDKDAVLAPDGTIFFVDLEGLEWITVAKAAVHEKLEDQIYRSLYELMYAYEQLERERSRRFGEIMDRKERFERILRHALEEDEIVSVRRNGERLDLVIGNILGEESLILSFPIIDW